MLAVHVHACYNAAHRFTVQGKPEACPGCYDHTAGSATYFTSAPLDCFVCSFGVCNKRPTIFQSASRTQSPCIAALGGNSTPTKARSTTAAPCAHRNRSKVKSPARLYSKDTDRTQYTPKLKKKNYHYKITAPGPPAAPRQSYTRAQHLAYRRRVRVSARPARTSRAVKRVPPPRAVSHDSNLHPSRQSTKTTTTGTSVPLKAPTPSAPIKPLHRPLDHKPLHRHPSESH